LKYAFWMIVLLAVAGCVSVRSVDPPDPARLDRNGQVRHYHGVDADRVLQAAETVLRRHRPDAAVVRERDSLVMEYRWRVFYVVMAASEEERWRIVARNVGGVTAASVAMSYASEEYVWPFSGVKGEEYPHEAGWRGAAVDVDYGMFWKRLDSVLQGHAWPECEKVKQEAGFRYFEPICQHRTVNRSEPG